MVGKGLIIISILNFFMGLWKKWLRTSVVLVWIGSSSCSLVIVCSTCQNISLVNQNNTSTYIHDTHERSCRHIHPGKHVN